jgi:ubiquinone/menaquinone biosynthesis C-methylase UbiE
MARYYAMASGPLQFQQPAHDLVSFLQISAGDTFLDIGSGSGLIAKAAMEVSRFVTALDSSIEMLRQQQNTGVRRVVADAQELPFDADTFDRIAAGFVITHLPDYRKGLKDWKRVLRPGGFLAATAWEVGTTKVSDVWKMTLKKYTDVALVDAEFCRIIPSDEFFSIRGNLVNAFKESGFVRVKEDMKTYLVSMEIEQYIETKIGSVEGTIVRKQVGPEQWDRLVEELNDQLQDQFSDRIEYSRKVHFVLGQKPI